MNLDPTLKICDFILKSSLLLLALSILTYPTISSANPLRSAAIGAANVIYKAELQGIRQRYRVSNRQIRPKALRKNYAKASGITSETKDSLPPRALTWDDVKFPEPQTAPKVPDGLIYLEDDLLAQGWQRFD